MAATKIKPAPCLIRRFSIPAIWDSFRKLDPRLLMRNPVMFVAGGGSIVTTANFLQPCARREVPGGSSCRLPCGSGSRCSSPTLPKPWPRAGARPRRPPCASPHPDPGQPASPQRRQVEPVPADPCARTMSSWSRPENHPRRTARLSKASPRWTSPPSPANPPRSSARAAATAAP